MSNPLEQLGKAAKKASYCLAAKTTAEKNTLLRDLAAQLEKNKDELLSANRRDIDEATAVGLSSAMIDRLLLTSDRISALAESVRDVCQLPDPVGEVIAGRDLPNGLFLMRKRVPLGVVAAIYEARPNVTVDVAVLCLKTGNAVILRGGKETKHTNAFLVQCIQKTLQNHGLPVETVQAITDPDRSLVDALLHLDAYVDMLIPRGGAALQQRCKEIARMPVIVGGIGVCHIFVDSSACKEKALGVIANAKTQRPSTCNSVETVLIHQDVASVFLPRLAEQMHALGVTLHPTEAAAPFLQGRQEELELVTDEELRNEWLSLDLNVHIVVDLQAAVEHIREYGSAHSDAILTESMDNAAFFVQAVDSAAVYVNASTRFTDGGEFGLGAEIAVSTQKLHARGPMGLDSLTTYKWVATGQYTVRQ